MTINLTQAETDAFTEMGITDIEAYLKNIASTHIEQKANEQLIQKTIEEKQQLLDS